jgi:hypothetical protein
VCGLFGTSALYHRRVWSPRGYQVMRRLDHSMIFVFIQRAGGFAAPIRIIPTAAAPDDNHERAGNNGVHWFKGLGAKDVLSVPLVDKASTNDATVAQSLRAAQLIYLLGGFTHYLGRTLKRARRWCNRPQWSRPITVAVDPLVVDALQSPDDAERDAARSELTLIAASAMADIHTGFIDG